MKDRTPISITIHSKDIKNALQLWINTKSLERVELKVAGFKINRSQSKCVITLEQDLIKESGDE